MLSYKYQLIIFINTLKLVLIKVKLDLHSLSLRLTVSDQFIIWKSVIIG